MKAFWCWERTKRGREGVCFEDAVREAKGETEEAEEVCAPALSAFEAYEGAVERFRELEQRVCEGGTTRRDRKSVV